MVAHWGVSSKAYKEASLEALKYFRFASSDGVSILTAIGIKNSEFGAMLEILKQGEIKHAHYLESIVKLLEKHELLNCDNVRGYCKVTDEGIKVVKRFNNAARDLDTILEGIDRFGTEILDKKYIILRGENLLRSYGILVDRPFIPKPEKYKNPFIQAFIEAEGEPYNFILKIISLPHTFAFLLIAGQITSYKTRYETYALTCKDKYGHPIGKETKEILEILRNKDIYPTADRIKEALRYYMKNYEIPWFKSPIQTFVASGLIEKVRGEAYCTCGITKYYKSRDNRYRLTKRGEKLAIWEALHILLS